MRANVDKGHPAASATRRTNADRRRPTPEKPGNMQGEALN